MNSMPAPANWYCVQTKPRAEAVALEQLERQRYHCLLPRIRRVVVASRTRPRKTVVEALFPRYLFLSADPSTQSLAPIRSTIGVIGLVRFAGQPARVDEAIIARLSRDAGVDGVIEPTPFQPAPGDRVQVMEGPFAGLMGVYAQANGEARAIVLLQLLGSQRAVRVPMDSLQAAAGACFA